MLLSAAGVLVATLVGLGCSPSSNADSTPSLEPEQAAVIEPAAGETGPSAAAPAPARTEPAAPPYVPHEEDLVTPHQTIEFADNLAHFLDALRAVDEGEQRVVRVVHMGASQIGADDLPAILRERFQTRFGDGGAGLVLMARYMSNYMHRWVKLDAKGWDHCYIAYKCLPDGHYGLGGTAFWAAHGAVTTISTRKDELGDEASKIELWYLARPGGGRVKIEVDGGEPVLVDTRAEDMEDRFYAIDVEPGPHTVEVRTAGHGNSRLYGVMLETDGPGVVWDQFSKLGVFTNRVLEWDAEHLAGQVRHRDPDLIVMTYGGNDLRRVANGKLDFDQYVEEYSAVVEHLRRGKPEASCLITGITDRGKSLTFDILPEHVEVIVAGQREVARRSGCAFFDVYTAMGGGGSLKEWKRRSPPLAADDLKHLNHRGRLVVGGWLYDAVIAAYVERRKQLAGVG
jgi:lysophospholipase L1-like esterase